MVKKFFIFTGISLGLLLLWMLWNMMQFSSRQIDFSIAEEIIIEDTEAVKHLSNAITYKTISPQDSTSIDSLTFLSFNNFLRETYPLTFATLEEEIFSNYTILLKWNGENRSSLNPILIMAHSDVVPIENLDNWNEPPFSGTVKDNYIWGRGAIDDKSSLIAILESIEYLISNDFIPGRDIYISFGHDEENTGKYGNAIIAQKLEQKGIYFDMVIDEGSIISNGVIKDTEKPVAMIGIAEKGYVSLKLTCNYKSGHSSMPGSNTTIGKLTKAITRLERKHMDPEITTPIRHFFNFLGPEMSIKNRLFLSNLTFFQSSVLRKLEKNPITSAMIRTTIAPTIISGGFKSNVLPQSAHAIINCRIRPGDSIEKVKEYIIKTMNDSDITVSTLENDLNSEPSKVSSIDSPEFDLIHKTIKEIFKDILLTPGLVVVTTDSRHYQNISKNIYRFMPVMLSNDEISMIHGDNERISKEAFLNMIRFYIRLINNVHST